MTTRALAAWALVVAVLAVASATLPALAALPAAVAIAAAVWRWPRVTLELTAVSVLAVRPALDVFSDRRYGLSEFAVSPAVAFGLVVLWVAAVTAVARARDGRPFWPSRRLFQAHAWLVAAYGVAFLSGARFYGATGAATGVRELVRVASIVAAFLIVLWWAEADPRRFARGWVYLVAGLVVPVGAALWQWNTGTGDLAVPGLNRLRGTFSHPNSLGPYVVPFILAALGGLTRGPGVGRLARVAGAAGLALVLAHTYSRTALLVLGTGLAVLPLLHSQRFGWTGLVRGLAVVALIGAVTWWLAGDVIRERFATIAVNRAVVDAARMGQSENSFTWRLINWGGLIALGLEHPVTGHGAGMTMVLNPLINLATGVPFNAHDDFVRFFFEGGASGVVCYLIYGVLFASWLLARARTAPPERAASAYAVAAAWIALFFLTAGTPELSLQTALQYELYGMAGLLNAPAEAAVPPMVPGSAARADAGLAV
jgi:O-antigen ligase